MLESRSVRGCASPERPVLLIFRIHATQNELFALPEAEEQGLVAGRLVKLPDPTTRVPREKPLPNKEKVMTRCVGCCGRGHSPAAEALSGAPSL